MITLTIESQCYRDQFDDWVASGNFQYDGKTYSWFASNENYAAGWNVQPTSDEDWNDIAEDELASITAFIEKCLYEHRTEYVQ